MKILTYNVSWQSMTGKSSNWKLCNSQNPDDPKYYGNCIYNIAKMIDENGPYDFILLQEATNYQKLIEISPTLQQMDFEYHKSNHDIIITFWDHRYQLMENLKGEFQPGRPWQCLQFVGNISIINVHLGHYNRHGFVNKLKKMVCQISEKLKNSRVIMGGDFNYFLNDPKNGFGHRLELENINFYVGKQILLSCCMPPFDKLKLQFDHILDSLSEPIKIVTPPVNKLSSDHIPIIAFLLPFNIKNGGYYKKYLTYKDTYKKLKCESFVTTY